ncbi:D-amino-acid oxidase [Amycolatopsis xylanica]|uniref:D-amino-acid oxidase n=1 Tax=Amycolatopsis xylanica TaxID=589385 RepID=A0A1H3J431_9PSEU|nr:FAD-dependent oxidoreductase [Amycolatopsis xylanica]SDY34345.1 D-amino-acid oxidase [Amycolatopsis xylanica]
MRVAVVGGGVIGLSCALRLARAGHDVTVVTADKPEHTTSAVAGGLVFPPPGTEPFAVCAKWTKVTVAGLARSGAPGVRFLPGRLMLPSRDADPGLASTLPGTAWDGDTLMFTTALVDTLVYLGWLAAEVAAAGVRTEHRLVRNLADLPADIVVNAAGLGGGVLAGDDTVSPIGGQVVHFADPGLLEWVVDDRSPVATYAIPHGGHVVCGGTKEPGRRTLEPDPVVAQDIVHRARRLVPELADARVLGTKVGLRPHRPEVRLERVGDVVHCYGHGGAGITLSWGCAEEVARLVV